MSAVTSQPLPFDRLEREKHIQVIFSAFQNRCGPSCQCHQESDEQLSGLTPGRETENMHPPGKVKRPGVEEQWPGGAAGSHFMSVLETVSQIHVTARPELQGPQCVPRRIYSITAGGSRSQLIVAVEESSCVCLQCCGPARACSLQGFDCQGRQVFYFERPLRVDACCLGCCLMEMRAYTPQKHLIGSVCQRWSMFTPLLEVCDAEGASAARIQGSCCPCRCFSNQQFQIVSNIGENVGTIWKKWPGFNDEHNMDHEYFGLEVPQRMEAHTKLLMLAATFLLNHMFFEMS
ncbi:phospholipid scramblase family member 5 [Acanthopagrus latus]|uniref:phospholipid scramblase family member 5 n=1 Tax=Acanthopagrus latus TaxID=8177 RepID=UPI00187CDCAD|nr:phospholipid scramblase family member 5 [Acanthopagrus latus]XP_036940292.1 phospholipid scramblase family member 5 [Acanthopagrus latus]